MARQQAISDVYQRAFEQHLSLMMSGGDVTKFTAFFLSCLAKLAVPRVQDDGEMSYCCYYCGTPLPKCGGRYVKASIPFLLRKIR